MYRIAMLSSLVLVVLGLLAPARGDAIKDVAALEKILQEAIQEADPAVACIMVSRSEVYPKYRIGGTSDPGQLGDFNLALIRQRFSPVQGESASLEKFDMSKPGYVPESYGSGVIIDESGLLLTNYHVVRDATKIFVRLPGDKEGYADIHAADPRSDLAVLRFVKAPPGLKALRIGDAAKVKKGAIVLAISHPFAAGFRDGSPGASWGIISNIRRRAPDPKEKTFESERKKTLHHYGTLLQTDARIHVGCSGGALVDLKGELIGLTTSLAALSGTESAGGFAVPMDAGMRRVVDVLKRGEEVEYGFLGVELRADVRPGEGVRVGVSSGSPAAQGGLRDSDVIVSVNGFPTRENDDLFLAVGTLLAGSEAKLEVRRDGQEGLVTLMVTLAKYYVQGPIIASRKPAPVRGLRIDYISVLIQALRTAPQPPVNVPSGVMVREVIPASPAANAMLRVNDIITHVNGKAVGSPKEFYAAAQNEKGPLVLTLDPGRQVRLD